MFVPRRLAKLNPRHRMRKAAILVMRAERGFLSPETPSGGTDAFSQEDYAALLKHLASDPEMPEMVRAAAAAAAATLSDAESRNRRANELRHALLDELGAPRADWDFLDPASGRLDPRSRKVVAGMRLYLEDIRSPFNLGTIFRTAEAFGAESILLSPRCADPRHPRAMRSSMGCVDILPWERLDGPPDLSEAFALELGGVDVEEFAFPVRGICVVGNEELGVSPETLSSCGLGRASIAMSGAKASLNVAVATGICLHAWRRSAGTRAG